MHGDDPGGDGHGTAGDVRWRWLCGVAGKGMREKVGPEGVVETGEGGDDGQPVEEGEVAAEDEDDLKKDHDDAGDMAGDAWPKAKSGATSSASQLNQTPILSRRCGRKWNQRLKGPGMGWVSK